jgi:Holliday junction resolvase|tara:strand:+ start:197 stop:598 length:402 start_codon:yes stop_codon:yes gene_type:complete
MSAKPESRLWKTLRDGVTNVHWTRIESWSSPGVPDVNACADFGEFWIELKVIKNNRVKLSPHQIAWHVTRSRFGGRSYILAREGGRSPLHLFSGHQAKDLADQKIGEISQMAKIEHPYDWDQFYQTLKKDWDK